MAALVIVVYLLLTLPLLLAGGIGGGRGSVLLLHAFAVSALVTIAEWRGAGRVRGVVADWLPLLLMPLLYAELPYLMEGLPGPVQYHDPTIVRLELGLWGAEPAYAWAGAWPSPLLSELLHLCYFSYYPLIYVPPLLLYRGIAGSATGVDRMAGFEETVLALVLAFVSCFAVFIVFPVQGPRYLGVPSGIPDGPVRRLVLLVLQGASSRGAAFPSSHVSVAVAQGWMALRHQPRVGRWTVLIVVGLAVGAVYGGFHYGIDAIAGGLVGVLAALGAAPLRRRLHGPEPGFTRTPEAV